MKDESSDHEFEGVSALIKKEEEAALVFFRTRNFRKRVESQLKATGSKKRPAHSLTRAIPVLATVLVAIAAGTYFLLTEHPVAGPAPEFRTLASALGQLPGFSHPPGREWTGQAGQTGTSRLANSIRLVLVTAEQIKREEEQRVSIPGGPVKAPRLSPDQRMEILFKDRAIERALELIRKDSKEV